MLYLPLKPSLIVLTTFLFFSCLAAYGQSKISSNFLVAFNDNQKDLCGYKNQKGDTIIPAKYVICFTDTFRIYALVLEQDRGFVAVNRTEKVLYNVFPFDNGPDYPSDGLFRIVANNKIGYADFKTGKIRIMPRYSCAMPFINGLAKVSTECDSIQTGEHFTWVSDNWFYIDKRGKKIYKRN